jgi:hypothetical protein
MFWPIAAYAQLYQQYNYIKKKTNTMSKNFCNGKDCSEYSNVFVETEEDLKPNK